MITRLKVQTRRVLYLILAGKSNKEIAVLCKIRRGTLLNYLKDLREELNIEHERQLFPIAEQLRKELQEK